VRYVLEASGKPKPRACFVPTASGESLPVIGVFYETYARFGLELDVLHFFRRTPQDLRAYLFAFDVVHVGGGNTRSMLAVWKHWGFDAVVREAWERGIVLCNCPHYDGEKDRRPSYQRLVASGAMRAGIACDDGVALHYKDDSLHAIVSARPPARAYRVEQADGALKETPLDALPLAGN
jgi:peptidase E